MVAQQFISGKQIIQAPAPAAVSRCEEADIQHAFLNAGSTAVCSLVKDIVISRIVFEIKGDGIPALQVFSDDASPGQDPGRFSFS